MTLHEAWSIISELIGRAKDTISRWIGIHLPLRVRYWVTMQMVGNALMQKEILERPVTWPFIYDHLERPRGRYARSERSKR